MDTQGRPWSDVGEGVVQMEPIWWVVILLVVFLGAGGVLLALRSERSDRDEHPQD